jgi:predicted amidohydrolase
MKITVCDFPDEADRKTAAWAALVDYTASVAPDLVILPEVPFCPWIFTGESVDPALWQDALNRHDAMLKSLNQLTCRWVMASRPVEDNGKRFNEAFLWSAGKGYCPARRKWYLPDAATARETVWFHKGYRFGLLYCVGKQAFARTRLVFRRKLDSITRGTHALRNLAGCPLCHCDHRSCRRGESKAAISTRSTADVFKINV